MLIVTWRAICRNPSVSMYLPEGIARPGPGEYLPDPTEGITRIEDLPKPKILRRSHVTGDSRAPRCGHSAYYKLSRVTEVL